MPTKTILDIYGNPITTGMMYIYDDGFTRIPVVCVGNDIDPEDDTKLLWLTRGTTALVDGGLDNSDPDSKLIPLLDTYRFFNVLENKIMKEYNDE